MVMMIVTVAAAYYPAGLRLGGSEPPTANTNSGLTLILLCSSTVIFLALKTRRGADKRNDKCLLQPLVSGPTLPHVRHSLQPTAAEARQRCCPKPFLFLQEQIKDIIIILTHQWEGKGVVEVENVTRA